MGKFSLKKNIVRFRKLISGIEIPVLLGSILLLVSLAFNIQVNKNQVNIIPPPKRIENALDEIDLPEGINGRQIAKYTQIDPYTYAIVQRPSANITIDNLANEESLFSGIMRTPIENKKWEIFLKVEDQETTNRNNIYSFWYEEGNFYTAVVDQNGAGSGEGNLKLFKSIDLKIWELIDCRNYVPEVGSVGSLADVARLTEKKDLTSSGCSNARIVAY